MPLLCLLRHFTSLYATFTYTLFRLVHLHQVEATGNAATLYGRTIQNHHVAILLKVKDQTMTVDVKAAESSLATALLQEVVDFFKI